MRTLVYAKRNIKELLSDPITLIFMLGLPVFLLLFMVLLNKNILQGVNEAYEVQNFVPSTIIFSFTFLTMFSGMLIAKDRTSEFLSRMFISPMKAYNYILGYILPLLLTALIQIIILYIVGFILGLNLSIHILASIPFLLLISLLFIALGLLLGSLLKDTQVSGVASIFIQVVAFTSGMWFSLDMVGGTYTTISYILPFAHSVDIVKYIISGSYGNIVIPFIVVLSYTIILVLISTFVFKKNMKN